MPFLKPQGQGLFSFASLFSVPSVENIYPISAKKTTKELCLMILKSDAKFEKKNQFVVSEITKFGEF